jgi:hypothetical protein
VGKQIQIVGDDLTVTNPLRIERAAKSGACNALLLKVRRYQHCFCVPASNAVRVHENFGGILPFTHD